MTAKSCSTSPRSRLDVGSSRISTRASSTMARLIATSCWMAIEWLDEHRAGVDLQRRGFSRCRAACACTRLPVDPAAASRLVAEHDVLADGQVRAEVDLLVHGRDAGGLRVGGAAEDDGRSPATVIDAGVDGVDAGQRLDEGRLPGAVLAHERVDLAGAQAEVDVVEGQDAREADGDAPHLDDRAALRACPVIAHVSHLSGVGGTPTGGPEGRPPGRVLSCRSG